MQYSWSDSKQSYCRVLKMNQTVPMNVFWREELNNRRIDEEGCFGAVSTVGIRFDHKALGVRKHIFPCLFFAFALMPNAPGSLAEGSSKSRSENNMGQKV